MTDATDSKDAIDKSKDPTEPALLCMICYKVLSIAEVTTLACMHVFHVECIERWANTQEKSMHVCCPFRCKLAGGLIIDDDEDLDHATGPAASRGTSSSEAAACGC